MSGNILNTVYYSMIAINSYVISLGLKFKTRGKLEISLVLV
jgi:hypothetical protein